MKKYQELRFMVENMNAGKLQVLCLLILYVTSLLVFMPFMDVDQKYQLVWRKYQTLRSQFNLQLLCLDLEGKTKHRQLNQSFVERCQFLQDSLKATLARDENVEKEAIKKTLELSQLVQHVTEFQFLVQSNLINVNNLLQAFRHLAVTLEYSLNSDSNKSLYYVNKLYKQINDDIWYQQEEGDCAKVPIHLCHFPAAKEPVGFGFLMIKTVNCLNEALVYKKRLMLDTSPGHPKHMLSLASHKCESFNCQNKSICANNTSNVKFQLVPTKYQKIESQSIFDIMTNPLAWYFGMLAGYFTRSQELGKMLHSRAQSYGIQVAAESFHTNSKKLTAGIYLGRICSSEKSTELDLAHYFLPVEEFFKRCDIKTGYDVPRRVFISTDDSKVISDARKRYPHYTLLYNDILSKKNISEDAVNNCNQRYGNLSNNSAVNDVLLDTLLLANVDFFVGTMSSSIARIVYSLRTASFPLTAHLTSISLDVEFYHRNFSRRLKAVQDNVVVVANGQVNFSSGNQIEALPAKLAIGKDISFWPQGFIFGNVVETGQVGLIPRFKTVTDIEKMSA